MGQNIVLWCQIDKFTNQNYILLKIQRSCGKGEQGRGGGRTTMPGSATQTKFGLGNLWLFMLVASLQHEATLSPPQRPTHKLFKSRPAPHRRCCCCCCCFCWWCWCSECALYYLIKCTHWLHTQISNFNCLWGMAKCAWRTISYVHI